MYWSRRELVKSGGLAAVGSAIGPGLLHSAAELQETAPISVEQWGTFETSFRGPTVGDPHAEVEFGATFAQGGKAIATAGFYDGGETYRVRFMPDTVGRWTYRTRSTHPELDGKTGSLTVHAARTGNHGPVQVKDEYRFAYADGAPYRELGTTCYAWTSQPAALEEQTLRTLGAAPFNKLRMCVFPKWFNYNRVEPPRYPFLRPGSKSVGFRKVQCGAFPALRAADRPVEGSGHRGRRNPVSSLRCGTLGIRQHGSRE